MQFPEFDPVLFSIGPLDIRWYALAYVGGIVVGWWYAARLAKANALWQPGKPPVTTIQLDDLILWITLGIILGGRLGYALFYQPQLYAQIFTGADLGERLAVLRLWDGGMSFHGGLIGVTLAIVLFARKNGVRLLSLGDLVAPAVPIGLFFGRIANFINGELWGRPTDVSWAVVFPHGGPLPRHPSQLYEAATEGLLLFLVIAWAIRLGALRRPGLVCGLFGIGYGVARIGCEFFREPDPQLGFLIAGSTMGMLLSLPLVFAGAWLTLRALRRPAVEPVRP